MSIGSLPCHPANVKQLCRVHAQNHLLHVKQTVSSLVQADLPGARCAGALRLTLKHWGHNARNVRTHTHTDPHIFMFFLSAHLCAHLLLCACTSLLGAGMLQRAFFRKARVSRMVNSSLRCLHDTRDKPEFKIPS